MKRKDPFANQPDTCFLTKTWPINQFKSKGFRELLKDLKASESVFGPVTAMVLSASAREGKSTFWLSYPSFCLLQKQDKYFGCPGFSGGQFSAWRHKAIELGYLEEIEKPVESDKKEDRKPGVYKIIKPEFVEAFNSNFEQGKYDFMASSVHQRWKKDYKNEEDHKDTSLLIRSSLKSDINTQISEDKTQFPNFTKEITENKIQTQLPSPASIEIKEEEVDSDFKSILFCSSSPSKEEDDEVKSLTFKEKVLIGNALGTIMRRNPKVAKFIDLFGHSIKSGRYKSHSPKLLYKYAHDLVEDMSYAFLSKVILQQCLFYDLTPQVALMVRDYCMKQYKAGLQKN